MNYDSGSGQFTWVGSNSDGTQQGGSSVRGGSTIASFTCGQACTVATLQVESAPKATLKISTNAATASIPQRFIVHLWF
jgi:hypothetical protein